MSNLWLDMFTAGTLANRPTAPNANLPVALYYATDTAQLFYWSGAAWSAVATASAPASATVLGPVKSDNGVTTSVAGDGTITVPKATASHLGVVKGDNATVAIAGDGTLSVTVASKGQFAFPGAVSQYVSSAIAAATQGNQFTPLVNMTIDQVVASWYGSGVGGHRYLCSVLGFNPGTRVVGVVIGAVAVIGTAANQDLTYSFSPALSLPAGASYAIVITDLDAGTTTTSCAVGGIGAASSLLPIYNTIPTVNSANDQRITLAKNTAPSGGDTFVATGGLAAVGIRAQF